MATAASLLLEMGMNIARLESDMRTATSKIQSFASGVKNVLGTIGVGLTVAGITAIAKDSAEAIQAFDRMGQQVGMSANELLKWEYVAKMADTDLETLAKSIKILDKNMFSAAQGTGRAFESFRVLGVSAKDATGSLKGNDEILKELADKFSKMPDGTMKTAMAMNIFGRAGASMIPVLNMGREGIEAFMKEAEELRGVLGDDLIARAEGVERAFKKFAMYRQAGRFQFFDGMSDAILRVAEAFQIVVKRGDGMRVMGEAVGGVLKALTTVTLFAVMGFYELVAVWEFAKRGWNDFVDFIATKMNAIATWVNEFSGNNVFPLFNAEKIKFESAKSIDEILNDLKKRVDSGSRAIKNLWTGAGPEIPIAPKVGKEGELPLPPSKKQLEAWAKVKEEYAKMIAAMNAEQIKLLPGIDEWDRKMADLNKRYFEYVAKLEEAKVKVPEHKADIDNMLKSLEAYHASISDAIRSEHDMAEALKATSDAMKSEQDILDDLMHMLFLKRPYMSSKEQIAAEVKILEQAVEGYRDLYYSTDQSTEVGRRQAEQLADLIKKNEQLVEIIKARATVEQDANAGMLAALAELTTQYQDQGQLMGDFTKRTFATMEDYLMDFIDTGKFEFEEFAKSIVKDLTRIFVQMAILEPMARNLKEALQSGGSQKPGGMLSGFGGMGGGGFDMFGNIFNSAKSMYDIWSLGGNAAVLGMLHQGGVAGSPTNTAKKISAPTSIMANEVPAILERGEVVISNSKVKELQSIFPSIIKQSEKVFGKSDKNTTVLKSLKEVIRKYHTGGVVGFERLHDGGQPKSGAATVLSKVTEKFYKDLKTNEIPVILERGEIVLSKPKVRELQSTYPLMMKHIEKTFGKTDKNTTVLKTLRDIIGISKYHTGGIVAPSKDLQKITNNISNEKIKASVLSKAKVREVQAALPAIITKIEKTFGKDKDTTLLKTVNQLIGVSKFHTGGIVRDIPNAVSKITNQYSKEIKSNEVPALLEKGEAVLPVKQVNNMRSLLPNAISKIEKVFGKSDKSVSILNSLRETIKAPHYHTGGIVGYAPLPRYHEGGLIANNTPAIMDNKIIQLPQKKTEAQKEQFTTEQAPSPQQVVQVFISAIDALSFMDLCQRNPQALIGPIENALKGNTSFRYTIKQTIR